MKNQSKKSAANGAAPADAATSSTILWDDAVAEGRKLVAQIEDAERKQLRLGELADKVQPIYGDETFAKFAAEIPYDEDTLGHYRTTYRAWKDILPPGANFPSFTVLKELAALPDRAALIKAEPKMSKRRAEVLRLLKDHPKILSENPGLSDAATARKLLSGEQAKGKKDDPPEWSGDSRGWFNAQVEQVNSVIHELTECMEKCTSEEHDNLHIEPELLAKALQKCLAKCAEYDKWLSKPSEEATDELLQKESRVVRTPAPAPIQPGA